MSCGNKDDDFTESIFDTDTPAVDPTASTAPFDQWLYDNFVVPYNTEIQYRFNFPASNLDFQLAPADYKKSQLLAHFIKYLFYDVYTLYGGQDFMKMYGPRIFHFIGSAAYSPTTGTETLGYASAGVKITLINVNNMKLWQENNQYTPADMELLNKDQFHTMHHEFSHILHQTKSYPVAYGQITPGTYDPRSWQDRDSVESHRLGYITQYGSSANYEDFVETLSCTITDTDHRWMNTIIDACANGGLKSGDKEQVYTLIDSLEIRGVDDPSKPWNQFSIYEETHVSGETGEETKRFVPSFHIDDARQEYASKGEDAPTYVKVADFTSFRAYLDWAEERATDEIGGMNAILKKIDIATKWYTTNWGLHLYEIRREVRKRQENINEFTRNNVVIYELK
jgi:substrate import-associated zinc metallohydrolase lipoprotein